MAELDTSVERLQPQHEQQSLTPLWNQFKLRTGVFLKELKNYTILLRNQLNDTDNPPTPLDLRTMESEVKHHEKYLDSFKEDFIQLQWQNKYQHKKYKM